MVSTPINVQTDQTEVNMILNALDAFIRQRSRIDWRDYGNDREGLRAYRAEIRSIGKDRKRALTALETVRAMREHSLPALIDSFARAFSGRLEWKVERVQVRRARTDGKRDRSSSNPRYPIVTEELRGRLAYTTGQYFPTEYRKAAASVLETYQAACNRQWAESHPQTFTYRTIEDVKRANRQVGGHWFDADTMRWFNTVIESRLIGGKYFVTSERMDRDQPKRYTVRRALPDGGVDTVGEFQQYMDVENARLAAKIESTKGR